MDKRDRDKRRMYQSLHARHGAVEVEVDPRACTIPDSLRDLPSVYLLIGLRTDPIPVGLRIADTELVAGLMFSGKVFQCRIPWSSVIAMYADGRKYDWAASVLYSEPVSEKRHVPHLRLVKS